MGLDDTIPDHTVLSRFRNLLVSEGLLKKLFGEIRPAVGEARRDPEARYACWMPR
ncbi:transposase [Mesorhizobium sp. M8A.F.Ca.ET.165.01.1.1]|nr:transposase [Mesorhizobium sp. M8A.F.Ca.ET.165.01.1.1]